MPVVGRIEAADTAGRMSHADGVGTARINMPALAHGLAGEELVEHQKTVTRARVDAAPWVGFGGRLIPAITVRWVTAVTARAVPGIHTGIVLGAFRIVDEVSARACLRAALLIGGSVPAVPCVLGGVVGAARSRCIVLWRIGTATV